VLRLQETSQAVRVVSGARIYSLHVSPHQLQGEALPCGIAEPGVTQASPLAQGGRLLALRTPYWLCVQCIRPLGMQYGCGPPSQGAGGTPGEALAWDLCPVAAVQAQSRIMDVAWNRVLPTEVLSRSPPDLPSWGGFSNGWASLI
jgi:hypothetical protein